MSFFDLFPLYLWFEQHLLPHLIKEKDGVWHPCPFEVIKLLA